MALLIPTLILGLLLGFVPTLTSMIMLRKKELARFEELHIEALEATYLDGFEDGWKEAVDDKEVIRDAWIAMSYEFPELETAG
jgi:hypothetical protein